jgi:hypothetical protein
MTVRSKATGAAMLAAPEAGVAVKAAGAAKAAAGSKSAAKGAGKGTGKGKQQSRNLNDLGSQEEREAELQRRREEAAAPKDANDPNNWGPNEFAGYQGEQRRQAREAEAAGPSPSSPGGGLGSVAMPAAASTGSGFLFGVFVWAVGLAYLRDGSTGVKQFLSAKFLNKVG